MNHRVAARLCDPGCERFFNGFIPCDAPETRSSVNRIEQVFVGLNTVLHCILSVAWILSRHMYHKITRTDNMKWVEIDGKKVIVQPRRCSHIVPAHDVLGMLVDVRWAWLINGPACHQFPTSDRARYVSVCANRAARLTYFLRRRHGA